jgi:glutathione S-transferase
MKLYVHPFSQHSRRVSMLCHELGLRPERVPVAMETGAHRTPEFLALNPAHAVPVLEDEGVVLPESHAIMRYLCARHRGERLYPADIAARAAVDRWLDWTHCSLNPPVQTLAIQVLFAGDERDEAIVQRARAEAGAALEVLDSALANPRGINQQTSLADLAIASTLSLYAMVGGGLTDTKRVHAYYEKLQALPCFAATAPNPAAA